MKKIENLTRKKKKITRKKIDVIDEKLCVDSTLI